MFKIFTLMWWIQIFAVFFQIIRWRNIYFTLENWYYVYNVSIQVCPWDVIHLLTMWKTQIDRALEDYRGRTFENSRGERRCQCYCSEFLLVCKIILSFNHKSLAWHMNMSCNNQNSENKTTPPNYFTAVPMQKIPSGGLWKCIDLLCKKRPHLLPCPPNLRHPSPATC